MRVCGQPEFSRLVMDASFDDPDYDYAASVAERAMRTMAEQRIPATPANFAVWFQYFAGSHDDLRNAIDLLIDHNRPFDVRTNQDLFETYVAPQVSAIVVDTSERLHTLMGAAKDFLATAIADNHSQMQAINEVADQGKAGVDPKALVAHERAGTRRHPYQRIDRCCAVPDRRSDHRFHRALRSRALSRQEQRPQSRGHRERTRRHRGCGLAPQPAIIISAAPLSMTVMPCSTTLLRPRCLAA